VSPQNPLGGQELEDPESIPSTISKGSRFEGVLSFRGAARIDGQLEGRIVAQGALFIGKGAEVSADVEVDELILEGKLTGEVKARKRAELRSTAQLAGSLETKSLSLAEGCNFDGRCSTASLGGKTNRNQGDSP